jgi:hypothetical protein
MLEHLLAEQADLVGTLGVEALPDGVEVDVHRVGAGRGELPEAAGHVAGSISTRSLTVISLSWSGGGVTI